MQEPDRVRVLGTGQNVFGRPRLQQVRDFQGHTLRVFRVVFSPDGTRLATSSSDGTAKVWDVATGQALFTLSGHTGGVQVAYSLDGTRLATSAIGAAKVWDASTGREVLSLSLPSGWGARVAFSPDGARPSVASTDTSVHVYLLHLDDPGAASDRHAEALVTFAVTLSL
jgi:WD40 repeat protein